MKAVYQTAAIVLIALVILFFGNSCTSRSGKKVKQTPTEVTVKAKLKCLTTSDKMKYGQLLIRQIDPMYNVGENIVICAHEFEILELENKEIDTLKLTY